MANKRACYGWDKDGKWYLSAMNANVPNRPRNEYGSKADALAEVKRRNLDVVWE